jgi:hypothetical protein
VQSTFNALPSDEYRGEGCMTQPVPKAGLLYDHDLAAATPSTLETHNREPPSCWRSVALVFGTATTPSNVHVQMRLF